MSTKYGEMLGTLEIVIGDKKLELHPRKGDNKNLMKIMMKAEKDETNFIELFDSFIMDILQREDSFFIEEEEKVGIKPTTDEEQKEFDMWVEFNLMPLVTEIMIAFRYTSREDVEMQKAFMRKKVMGSP